MKEIAEEYLGKKVTHAVVTVPAYFNDAQRQATKDAGSISGLTIIRIINEPTAAAIAYGLDKKDSEKSILVFDLGGGTFDVSILLIDNGVFEVVATNGDTHLGGEDFDNRVMEYFLGLFEKKSGMDARSDNRAVQKLRREVEKAKRTLSSEFNTRIEIDSFFDGQDFSESFTRARFEELNADLFKRTLVPVEKVLKDGHLKKSDISEIVMVGGSTRIPKVQELVRQFFDGKDLNKGINPDEAIAYGAAVQAGLLSGEEMAKELVLLDVCPLTLGIEVKGEVMSKIITRNTVIPTKKSQIFTTTHNNQNMIKVKIFEGERVMTKDNNLLGEFDLSGIASAPAGGPQIEVTFQIDANGILRVSAEDKASGSKNNIVINNNKGRLSDEQIERMIAEAEKFAEDDRKIRERIEAKSQFESYVYSLKASFDKIKSKLNAHDQETLQYAIDERINWLDASDAVSAADFQEQKKELEDIASPIMERFYENKQERKKTDDEL
jgi:molecular chaperone DnaK (HSP70)